MIKHGPVYPYIGNKDSLRNSHLFPVAKFVTKGIADAREDIQLDLQVCDIKGAKRFNGQQCVVAKALNRKFKPQAVAVGRSMAYVVIKGLAVRFNMGKSATKIAEEFDARGRAHLTPIKLLAVAESQKLRTRKSKVHTETGKGKKRMKKLGVRATGGGVVI